MAFWLVAYFAKRLATVMRMDRALRPMASAAAFIDCPLASTAPAMRVAGMSVLERLVREQIRGGRPAWWCAATAPSCPGCPRWARRSR